MNLLAGKFRLNRRLVAFVSIFQLCVSGCAEYIGDGAKWIVFSSVGGKNLCALGVGALAVGLRGVELQVSRWGAEV